MASQKFSGVFQDNFDPKHKTVKKTADTAAKVFKKKIAKDEKKNKKFRDKRQYIATQGPG